LDIVFGSGKHRKLFNKQTLLVRKFGSLRAKFIRRRLDDLAAAEVLEHMLGLPGRCHELGEDRKGQLAVDLDGPYRLVFVPANDPIPCTTDGGLDWSKVTAVQILEVTNYHGK